MKWLSLIAFCLGSLTFFVLVGGFAGALLGTWLGEKAPPIAHILILVSTIAGAALTSIVGGLWIYSLTQKALAAGSGTPRELIYLQIPLAALVLVALFSGMSSYIRDARKPIQERIATAIWDNLLINPGQIPAPAASEVFDTHGVLTRYPEPGTGILNELEQPGWRIRWDLRASVIRYYCKLTPSSTTPSLPQGVSLKQGEWPQSLNAVPQEGAGSDYWLEAQQEASSILSGPNPIQKLIQLSYQIQAPAQ